jgi:SAM-dependent methyltransferase
VEDTGVTEQYQHDLLVTRTHDEQHRQEFVMSLRRHLASQIAPHCGDMYTDDLKAAYTDEHGHEPRDRAEIRQAMRGSGLYQLFSVMQRTSQELMWDSAIDSVERELPRLIAKSKVLAAKRTHGGTLTLDSELEIPNYLTAYDIHLQPGGYHVEYCADDVAAGALWDRAIYVYSMGYLGPEMDYWGQSLANYYRDHLGGAEPRRILDMGCTMGASTVPWKKIFPEAEVHGIDVGPALLRYAHARAESMGHGVHFSQQNAEHTNFEDASFDVVASGLLMHETSRRGVNRIFSESRRLLKSGGVMMHMDPPQFIDMAPLKAFLAAWEAYNVNENFAGVYRDMDLAGEAIKAGFAEDAARVAMVDLVVPPEFQNYATPISQWPTVIAEKS